MRSAPFGFFEQAWDLAWECAAITHGHIEAKASAAILAEAIRLLTADYDMEDALRRACVRDSDNTESSRLILKVISLAKSETEPELAIRELGEGWVAEEALAIAAYCAVRAGNDIEQALRLAVNHDGDSDSTGSITGNLMGAAYGTQIIPDRWLQAIELREVIEQVASDLIADVPTAPWYNATEEQKAKEKEFWDRYPGC
jgi:ADP-ribosyl-[dinitrogen reductase] hydrolase